MNDRTRDNFDLDRLLHPAQAFEHPSDVVNDSDLTLNEKRTILASWASDACALEATPHLRAAPSKHPVPYDEVIEALRLLDAVSHDRCRDRARYRGFAPRSRLNRRHSRPDQAGPSVH